MLRSRPIMRLRARPAHSGSRRGTARGLVASATTPPSAALLDLHAASDAEGIYKAIRVLLGERLGPCLTALMLRSLPEDRARTYGAPPWGLSEEDLSAWIERLDELRRRKRTKVLRLAELSEADRARASEPRSRSRLRSNSVLLGFDGCGYSQAALLVSRARGGELEESALAELVHLHPHFVTALRSVRTLQREHVTRLALQKLFARFPVAVLLLDWDGSLLYKNSAATEVCARWNFGDQACSLNATQVFRLPKEVLRACRALAARSADDLAGYVRSTTVSSANAKGLRAVVQTLRFEAQPFSRPRYLVHFESPAAGGIASDGRLSLMIGLTPRERELAELVARGLGNAEIARKLGKSPHTVKKQLQGIFRKLDVSSRAKLMALLVR